jgi:putative membrane protein
MNMPETVTSTIDQTPTQNRYSRYTLPAAVAVLVIFHAVGFWGLLFSEDPGYFQTLTPFNLLLTNFLLFSFHRRWNASFLIFAIVVMVAGFLAEVVGVHTGLLFGNYRYGASLGVHLWEVPLLIGLNWLMLVYATGHIANYTRLHWLLKAVLGGVLMVVLDFFLEPVAMQFDFWQWKDGHIPLSNFSGWLLLAILLHVFFQRANFFKRNSLAPFVYVVQLLFFVGLYLFLQV